MRSTWARAHLEFDLMLVPRDETASMVFWNVMRCGAMELRPPFLDVAAQASARHGVAVCKALGNGVLDARAAPGCTAGAALRCPPGSSSISP